LIDRPAFFDDVKPHTPSTGELADPIPGRLARVTAQIMIGQESVQVGEEIQLTAITHLHTLSLYLYPWT
jgi:hypothetical protein